jgi:predicted PurR-regulated permease PerM
MVVAQHISTSSAFLCITKDFISTFLISVFIVYILHPLYKFLLKHTGIKIISAFASLAVAAAANTRQLGWKDRVL